MYRTHNNYQRLSLNTTPAKNNKYDNYTPRKRYTKEPPPANYLQSFNPNSHVSPLKQTEQTYLLPRTRNLSSSRRKVGRRVEDIQVQPAPSKARQLPLFDLPEALQDCTAMINSRPSFRQQRFKKSAQQVQISQRLGLDNENRDVTNYCRQKRIKMVEPEPLNLTPRKYQINKENIDISLTEKMTSLQNKIARLERMTPQKPATPRNSRINENYGYESSVVLLEKEEQHKQSVSSSQVSAVSDRENELLSRVSLGRLMEEQEGSGEIEMIQDLSYRISCKLKSIIRNFS